MKVKLTTLKVTEYVPAYNYMQEIHVVYDFVNHKYQVDGGKWKSMNEKYEQEIKARYSVA